MENIQVVSDDQDFFLPLYKDKAFFFDGHGYKAYESFIKGVEKIVRGDERYISYIAKLKSEGLDRCAILGNLSGEKVDIEMHHGPMFGLFDIADIITRALFKRGEEKITTFLVADYILMEHEKDHVQIVMMAKTPHKAFHISHMFIHAKQSFGRVDLFMEDWLDGMTSGHGAKIEKYIEYCKKYKSSTDNGLFDTNKKLKFKKFHQKIKK